MKSLSAQQYIELFYEFMAKHKLCVNDYIHIRSIPYELLTPDELLLREYYKIKRPFLLYFPQTTKCVQIRQILGETGEFIVRDSMLDRRIPWWYVEDKDLSPIEKFVLKSGLNTIQRKSLTSLVKKLERMKKSKKPLDI